MIDLVIFDLDGTLVDTVEDLAYAVNYALSTNNLDTHSVEEYRLMVGNGVSKLVQRAMPTELQDDSSLHKKLLEIFLGYYKAHIVDKSQLYPGLYDIVYRLKERGVKVAIASNKFQEGTQTVINHFFKDIDIDAVYGVREGFPLKPNPAVVNAIVSETKSKIENSIMVGDSGTDMQTARNAGIIGIGVAWGFRPEDAKRLAGYFVESPEELGNLLNELL